ncbi:MAG: hypothetical protein K0Q73_2738 [Paenibacillus sp.]|nr:hypothetical protein [Paenibacillus sp.]
MLTLINCEKNRQQSVSPSALNHDNIGYAVVRRGSRAYLYGATAKGDISDCSQLHIRQFMNRAVNFSFHLTPIYQKNGINCMRNFLIYVSFLPYFVFTS